MSDPAMVPDLAALAVEADKLLASSRLCSERFAEHTRRSAAETDSIVAQAKDLHGAISEKREYVLAAARGGNASAELRGVGAELDRACSVLEGRGPGGNMKVLFHRLPNPGFLNLLLGRINVQASRHDHSIRIKEEYYRFRDRTAPMFVLFPGLLMVLLQQTGGVITTPLLYTIQAYQCWLLYFYASLSLREGVLMVNGSSIKPWWIRHHYLSIAMALVTLTMPVRSPAFETFLPRVLAWAVLQGTVMLLQNRYQRRRMYTRIALGKAQAMDVVSGESSGVSGQLLLLYPLLFALQGMQFQIGAETVYNTTRSLASPSPGEGDIPAALCGALFLAMSIGNITATASTLKAKRRVKKERANMHAHAN